MGHSITAAIQAQFVRSTQSVVQSPDNVTAAGTPLVQATAIVLEQHYRHTTRYRQSRTAYKQLCALFPDATLEDLSIAMLRQWVVVMRARGNVPSTINCKLSTVGKLFKHFDVYGRKVPYVAKAKDLKWWLTPEMEGAAITWLRENNCHDLAVYVRWTVLTGLRVHETLRVQRHHFTGLTTDTPALTVPGTKSGAAQATIPLFPEAAAIAARLLGTNGTATDHLFVIPYVDLALQWRACRKAIGLQGTHGATLKALRRSFARLATERGLPTELLRLYLRHSNIETTVGYLRLVGGYATEQMRQWFR